jgi:protein-S-isoprenylcysteine O-methyltransferase Ste14
MSERRGGGWVVAQFVLMAFVVAAGLVGPGWTGGGARPVLRVAGAALVLAGGALAVRAARALGRSLTPFPLPSAAGTLVEHGGYGVVRHPIYTGGILVLTGFSLWTGVWALALTAVLAVLWALKARVEERHLAARYPAYGAYCSRVRWRLIPFVY